MTTIAYRNGIMAADRMAYLGRHESVHARKCKINRAADGSLVGVSSNIVGATYNFMRWFNEGQDPESWPKIADAERESVFTVLAVHPDGSMSYWNDSYMPTPIDAEYIAIGSGRDFALGAMARGATAKQAVAVASKFDPFTVNDIDIVHLKQGD